MLLNYTLAAQMKLRFTVAAILFATVLVFANTNIAQAQWPAISSGYAVTTNWHGQEVPLGESVTAWAGTTHSEVENVEFLWIAPDEETVVWDPWIEVFGPYTTPAVPDGVPQEIIDWAEDHLGVDIWYAQNTQTPDVLGDWGVQALFHAGSGKIKGQDSTIVAIRASSINAVPEVPFGTIAISLSMFVILGVFAIKRKRGLSLEVPT